MRVTASLRVKNYINLLFFGVGLLLRSPMPRKIHGMQLVSFLEKIP
jgi:hypothetical protein